MPSILLAALLLAASAPAGGLTSVSDAVAAAERRWDADAAVAALSRARSLAHIAPDPAAIALQVRAGLLAAELLRVRYEGTPVSQTMARQTLGQQIDVIAGEALAALATEPAGSERARTEADLVATMIRSDFRAKKYEAQFKAAVTLARRLDPHNARALVSASKPFLFAPEGHGRDVNAGIALLDEALTLDEHLEPARLLRAWAREGLGDHTGAITDWRAALAENPDCAPAAKALAAAERRGSGGLWRTE
jgi:hypothetical protein